MEIKFEKNIVIKAFIYYYYLSYIYIWSFPILYLQITKIKHLFSLDIGIKYFFKQPCIIYINIKYVPHNVVCNSRNKLCM